MHNSAPGIGWPCQDETRQRKVFVRFIFHWTGIGHYMQMSEHELFCLQPASNCQMNPFPILLCVVALAPFRSRIHFPGTKPIFLIELKYHIQLMVAGKIKILMVGIKSSMYTNPLCIIDGYETAYITTWYAHIPSHFLLVVSDDELHIWFSWNLQDPFVAIIIHLANLLDT